MRFWDVISNLGIKANQEPIDQRNNILSNRINFIIAVIFIFLLIIVRTDGYLAGNPPGMGTYRSILVILMSGLNLFLAFKGKLLISKLNLVFFAPALIIIIPTLFHDVENESYVYYQYVLIGLSVIVPLVFSYRSEPWVYFISFVYYFVLINLVDIFLNYFSLQLLPIVHILESGYLYYKIVPVIVFFFVHFAVFYLRKLNENYSALIVVKGQLLNTKNEELNQMLCELKSTQRKLVQSEKMAALGNITTGVSHEINNPLNYMAGGLFLIGELKDRVLKEKMKSFGEIAAALEKPESMIADGISRVSHIINKLSVLSGMAEQEKNLEDLNEIIESKFQQLAELDRSKIKIEKEYFLSRPTLVYREAFVELIEILFENAIEAIYDSVQPKLLQIKTLEDDNNAVIQIINSGSHLSENNLKRVFDPFFTTKGRVLQSGLGLSIAYTIIQEHDGEITLQNDKIGIKVVVRLPIKI